jgi:hypothetical protein
MSLWHSDKRDNWAALQDDFKWLCPNLVRTAQDCLQPRPIDIELLDSSGLRRLPGYQSRSECAGLLAVDLGFAGHRLVMAAEPVKTDLFRALHLNDARLVNGDLNNAKANGANLLLHHLYPVYALRFRSYVSHKLYQLNAYTIYVNRVTRH